jgi:tetratricopeptide (TPR) repeat protein
MDQAQLLRQVRAALKQEDYPRAIQALGQAISLAQKESDHGAVARHEGNLASIYYRQGQPDEALHHFEIALEHARLDDDRSLEAGLLGNAGSLLREVGRYDEAAACLKLALEFATEIGDERGRGIWLGTLGLVCDDQKQFDMAVHHHTESIIVARKLRDLRGLAGRLGNLAQAYIAKGEYPTALIHLQEAIMIHRDLNDKPLLAARLMLIGNLYTQLGQRTATRSGKAYVYHRALEHYRECLSTAYDAGDNALQADALRIMGGIFLEMGDNDQAINHLDMAYQVFERMGLREPLAQLNVAIEQARRARAG